MSLCTVEYENVYLYINTHINTKIQVWKYTPQTVNSGFSNTEVVLGVKKGKGQSEGRFSAFTLYIYIHSNSETVGSRMGYAIKKLLLG